MDRFFKRLDPLYVREAHFSKKELGTYAESVALSLAEEGLQAGMSRLSTVLGGLEKKDKAWVLDEVKKCVEKSAAANKQEILAEIATHYG